MSARTLVEESQGRVVLAPYSGSPWSAVHVLQAMANAESLECEVAELKGQLETTKEQLQVCKYFLLLTYEKLASHQTTVLIYGTL